MQHFTPGSDAAHTAHLGLVVSTGADLWLHPSRPPHSRRVPRPLSHAETHGPTPMPTSVNDVPRTDVFDRLCVTCGVW